MGISSSTTDARTATAPLPRRESYDVAVIGAGVVGCAIARSFAIRGFSVLVLEKGGDILEGASKGNSALLKQFEEQVKNGKDATFNVIPTGSVLTRTSVAVNGVKGEMKDLQPGKRVLIYWVEDPKKKGELFARKIDVVLSEEELNKRYEVVE